MTLASEPWTIGHCDRDKARLALLCIHPNFRWPRGKEGHLVLDGLTLKETSADLKTGQRRSRPTCDHGRLQTSPSCTDPVYLMNRGDRPTNIRFNKCTSIFHELQFTGGALKPPVLDLQA